MPKIKVLDRRVAELIAAGEVVDRPASVIKELAENSVDAGSSAITVEINNGGISYMRVTDNGCGIAKEDIPTAFLRHATSKIDREDDLDAISTLGFRGEALASISAVSHVEMLTRTPDSPIGARFTCGGSEETSIEDAGCPVGTTIVIRDLFFNTPARMKFLKKDVTEGNAVSSVMDKLALSHPEISFRFIREGKEVLHTPGDNKLSSAIYRVYGREFLSTLIPVEYEYEHIKVWGYISAPAHSRPNRSMQNFFLNGRYVRSRTMMAALEEAYKGSIMTGKFPACVLHMQLGFGAVDVNVHPAKLEVRFIDERPIFEAVYHAVRSAIDTKDFPKTMNLSKKTQLPLKPHMENHREFFKTVPGASFRQASPADSVKPTGEILHDSGGKGIGFTRFADEILEEEDQKIFDSERKPAQTTQPEKRDETDSYELEAAKPFALGEMHSHIIGEAFNTYIIAEYSGDALMFIDKHAAHERLLYERLRSSQEGRDAQNLLSPVTVVLEKNEYSALLSSASELRKAGFEIEDFGEGTVIVRTVPMLLSEGDIPGTVMEIAGYLSEQKHDITPEHLDWIYHNVACRAAVKGGDQMSREELVALAEELERNPSIRYCPHGRPVYILLKKKDIERQFGRV